MKDLETAVAASLETLIASGAVKKVIDKQVEATVTAMLGDMLGRYSPFAKALQEALGKQMDFDLEKLGMAGYNAVVLEIVRRKLDEAVHVVGRQQIEKDLAALLATPPEQITLTELVTQFKNWSVEKERWQREPMELSVEIDNHMPVLGPTDYRHTTLLLLLRSSRLSQARHSCEVRIMSASEKDGAERICGLWMQGDDVKNRLLMGQLYGFEKQLFQLYAAKTKLIADAFEFDLDIERDRD